MQLGTRVTPSACGLTNSCELFLWLLGPPLSIPALVCPSTVFAFLSALWAPCFAGVLLWAAPALPPFLVFSLVAFTRTGLRFLFLPDHRDGPTQRWSARKGPLLLCIILSPKPRKRTTSARKCTLQLILHLFQKHVQCFSWRQSGSKWEGQLHQVTSPRRSMRVHHWACGMDRAGFLTLSKCASWSSVNDARLLRRPCNHSSCSLSASPSQILLPEASGARSSFSPIRPLLPTQDCSSIPEESRSPSLKRRTGRSVRSFDSCHANIIHCLQVQFLFQNVLGIPCVFVVRTLKVIKSWVSTLLCLSWFHRCARARLQQITVWAFLIKRCNSFCLYMESFQVPLLSQ